MTNRPILSRLSRMAMVFAFAIGLAAAPTAVMAQSQNFTADQLDAFAETVVAVNPLIMDWNQKIQQAESQEQAQAMAEEAQAEVVAAIEDGGLTVETYNQIAQAAQNDDQLRKEIEDRLPESPGQQQ